MANNLDTTQQQFERRIRSRLFNIGGLRYAFQHRPAAFRGGYRDARARTTENVS
jgi:hypothetical protein